MAYNRAILMGRLTRDPELRTTPQGTNVCSFSIAVDRRFSGKGDDKKTDFFNIVAWREKGEFVSRYFKKGNMVLVEGEIQTRQYVNKDGITVSTIDIVADQIAFTGEKTSGSSGSHYSDDPGYGEPPPESRGDKSSSTESKAHNADFSNADSDDYPF